VSSRWKARGGSGRDALFIQIERGERREERGERREERERDSVGLLTHR